MSLAAILLSSTALRGRGGVPPPIPAALAGPFLSNDTIAETAADEVDAGVLVGYLSATGGTGPYTYSLTSSDFEIVNGNELRTKSGNTLTDASTPTLTIEVEDAVAVTSDAEFPITVTDYLAEVEIATFDAINWDGSNASPGIFYTAALLFPRGEIPSGSTIIVRRQSDNVQVPSAMDGPILWDDDSLMSPGQLNVVDSSDFGAGATRTYKVMRATGSHTPAASGFDPWAWISGDADRDVQIRLTNMVDSAGAALSPAARTASLATMIGTTTRRFRTLDDAQIQCINCWGMFANDGHRKMEFYGQMYRDSGGNVLGMFYDALTAHDWIPANPLAVNAETKDKVAFNMALYHGDTLIDTYYGDDAGTVKVQLPYHSACVATPTAGTLVGQMRWLAGTESRTPTVWVKPPLAVLNASRVFPPLDTTNAAAMDSALDWIGNSGGSDTRTDKYVPGHHFGHQPVDGNAGGFPGRGMIYSYEAAFFMNPTFSNYRRCLQRGMAALHRPLARARNHLTDSTIGDITNRPIPYQTQSNQTVSTAGFVTGDIAGLGTRQIYQNGKTTSPFTLVWGTVTPASNTYSTPASAPVGGWSSSLGQTHRVSWGFGMAIATGRRIFRNACIDNFFSVFWMHGSNISICADNIGREMTTFTGGQTRAAFGWSNRYFTPGLNSIVDVRGLGLPVSAMSNGWLVAASNDPIKAHMEEIIDVLIARQDQRRQFIAAQTSQNQYNRGVDWQRIHPNTQFFEVAFCHWAFTMLHRRMPANTALLAYVKWTARQYLQILSSNVPLKIIGLYYQGLPSNDDPYNPPAGFDYPNVDLFSSFLKTTVGDSTLLQTAGTHGSNTAWKHSFRPTIGDVVQFSEASTTETGFPPNFVRRTNYHVIQTPTDFTFRVSETAGGPVFDPGVPSNTSNPFIAWCETPARYVGDTDPFQTEFYNQQNADDYIPDNLTAITLMLDLPSYDITFEQVTAARTAARGIWDATKAMRDPLLASSPSGAQWAWERP